MSEEELKEIFDYLDRRLIICNTVKEPINKDLDCAIKLSVAYEDLQQRIDKAINDLEIIIDIIKEQPTSNEAWILERLESNKSILKGDKNE